MTIKLLIADDHELVRVGLKQLLAGSDIKIMAEASTGEATLRAISKHKPDVVLLDVRMSEGDGLNTLGRIRLDRPALPVLMFSAFDNPAYIARAVALGANGYLLKGASRNKLIESIRTASTGESTWTREELRVTGALMAPRNNAGEALLTPRESDVLRQLTRGLTNKGIALALKISDMTVKEHVEQILRKIGVTDRTQAAVWAARNELPDAAGPLRNRSRGR